MDDILNARTEAFMKKEEVKIIKAKFKTKIRIIFEICILKNYNGC